MRVPLYISWVTKNKRKKTVLLRHLWFLEICREESPDKCNDGHQRNDQDKQEQDIHIVLNNRHGAKIISCKDDHKRP